MTKTIDFNGHFVKAITGFQERKTKTNGYVTDINVGSNTFRVNGSLEQVAADMFPHQLAKTVPATFMRSRGFSLPGEVSPDLQIHRKPDPTGW